MLTFMRLRAVLTRLAPILLLLLSACGSDDPFVAEYVTTRPDESVLPGVYVFKWQTLTDDDPPAFNGARIAITLRADGTFSADNLPLWRETAPAQHELERLANLSGNWKLAAFGVVADGDRFRDIWTLDFGPPAKFANLTKASAPHGLLFTFGDPDNGDVMYFEQNAP
jgi:hypothetical protein